MPKSQRGQGVEPEAAEEAAVGERAADGAGACVSRVPRRAGWRPRRRARAATTPTTRERDPDADGVGDGAEHGAEDGAEDGRAEGGPDQLAAALAWGRDGEPGERARPRGRARDALDEPGEPERPGRRPASGEREARRPRAARGPATTATLRPAARRRRARRGSRRAARRRRRRRRAARRRSSRARTPPRSRARAARATPNSIASTNTTTRDENEKPAHPADVTGRRHDVENRSATEPRRGHEPSGPTPMSEPRVRRTQLQGSWRETGSASADPVSDCATNKFSEPGALSSSTPTNFRLPPTAYRSGLDLLASRARCKGESRGVTIRCVKGSKSEEVANCDLFLKQRTNLPSDALSDR